MSLSGAGQFDVQSLPIGDVESGMSILLTGEDTDALKTVFANLMAAEEDEYAIVLATNSGGQSMKRELDNAKRGAGSRAAVLTCEGPARGEEITVIDDLGDLTTLGMEFSNLVASAEQSTGRFRSGIYLCSTIVGEVDDTRSVYRFLNTTFLTDLRRGDGLGVCAVDTSAALDTDIDSMVAGLETSLSARIHVERVNRREVELTLSGFGSEDGTVTVDL
jgi:hypothetical protein